MTFEQDVISRLTRLEEKVDSMQQRHKNTRAMLITITAAIIVAFGTISAAILQHIW